MDLVLGGQQDDVVALVDHARADDLAGLVGQAHVQDALAAARLDPVLVDGGALAEAALADREQLVALRVAGNLAGHDHVVPAQGHALDASGGAAHGPGGR